jgi:hypothetical protein
MLDTVLNTSLLLAKHKAWKESSAQFTCLVVVVGKGRGRQGVLTNTGLTTLAPAT